MPSTLEISAGQLAETRSLRISSAAEHPELMGRTIPEQIGTVWSYAQLKGYISRWHMTLRESKGGLTIADEQIAKMQIIFNSN